MKLKKITDETIEQCEQELINNEAQVLYSMYKASDTLQDMVGKTFEYPGPDDTTNTVTVTENKCVVKFENGETHTYTEES